MDSASFILASFSEVISQLAAFENQFLWSTADLCAARAQLEFCVVMNRVHIADLIGADANFESLRQRADISANQMHVAEDLVTKFEFATNAITLQISTLRAQISSKFAETTLILQTDAAARMQFMSR